MEKFPFPISKILILFPESIPVLWQVNLVKQKSTGPKLGRFCEKTLDVLLANVYLTLGIFCVVYIFPTVT